MNALKKILFVMLASVFTISLAACKTSNLLDISTYCRDTINYELADNKKTEGKFELAKINNANCDFNQYSKIQITTNRDWTYGLEIERIEFDIILSAPADIDIDVTLSNLENGPHLNEEKNTYYYHKTLSINKESTPVKLDINDIFNDQDSVLSIEIDKSCYTTNPDLKIAIGNLKMYGQHTPVNY